MSGDDPDEWVGEVAVAVAADELGHTVYPTLRSSGALAVRAHGDQAFIVGAGAHPIGGDRLRVDLHVGRDAHLTVRSTSATLARAGDPPAESLLAVEVSVGAGGVLRWLPEPGVAARGCVHRTSARIALAPTARLVWSDSIVLGRAGEEPGSWLSALRVEVDAHPLLVNELALGPAHLAWSTPSVLGGARVATSLVVVDPGQGSPMATVLDQVKGSLIPLGANGFAAVVWGATHMECQQSLRELRQAAEVDRWPDLNERSMATAA